jgi:sec-independent protein translocase protein TatA
MWQYQSAKRVTTMFEGLFQPTHLLVIIIIAIFVFGPKKLPELGKGLGDAIRGFKQAVNEGEGKPAVSATSATPAATTTTASTTEQKPPTQA